MVRFKELNREMASLVLKAHALHVREVISDRPRVEQIIKEQIDLMPNEPWMHLQLADFYDRVGRYREALEQWNLANKPSRSWSSALNSPRILSHYGDLALRLGETQMAADSYEKAGGRILKSGEVNNNDLPSDKLEALKEAAHYASAVERVPGGELYEALADYRIAMPLMDGSWEAHLGYGRLLHRLTYNTPAKDRLKRINEAKKEFHTAERLAPDGESAKAIHKERMRLWPIPTVVRTVITNGKAVTTIEKLSDNGH
jgi:tetratricopeptide (TPR) repeat protein